MTGAEVAVSDSKGSTGGRAQFFLEKATFRENFLKEINLDVFAEFPPYLQPHLGETRERLPRRSIENTVCFLYYCSSNSHSEYLCSLWLSS